MKEKIKNMYIKAINDELPPNIFADQILSLFRGSGSLPDIDSFMKWMVEHNWIEELYNTEYDHENKKWQDYTPHELYLKYLSEANG